MKKRLYKATMIETVTAICLGAGLLAGCGSAVPGNAVGQEVSEPAAEQTAQEQSVEITASEQASDADPGAQHSAGETVAQNADELSAGQVSEDKGNGSVSDDDIKKAVSAYVAYMKDGDNFSDSGFAVDCRYAMIHLDDDEMPELAVVFDSSHPSGVHFLTYVEGEVKEIETFGSLGKALYEKGTGVMFGYYTGMGETFTRAACFKDGELKEEVTVEVLNLEYSFDSEEKTGYKYYDPGNSEAENNGEITEEEYNSLIGPYLPDVREYRLVDFDLLPGINDTDDPEKALMDSLSKEDELPKPDAGWYGTVIED
ncbi:MAG: hypothetical protein K6E33_02675 [Lachnospiraceae bacterium]|nr:hypothetical protein [Lachnospiraceae bacterium]